MINENTKNRLYSAVLEELENCHRGQAMDIYWHKNNIVPTEKEYLGMCSLKTGSLARMSARFGAVLAGKDTKTENEFSDFATSLGVAFQIQDDILNLSGNLGKANGDDITEGKKSLPVIYCLRKAAANDRKRLLRILNTKTRNKRLIFEAIMIINKYDSLSYANNVAKDLVSMSWKKIKNKIKDKKAKKELELFKSFVAERDF